MLEVAPDIRLSDLYEFPDLIEYTEQSGEVEKKHIKGELLLDRVLQSEQLLITGAEKSGKTALAKQLVLQLRRAESYPVLLDGDEVATAYSKNKLPALLNNALQKQYNDLSGDAYHQLCEPNRVILIDSFEAVYEQGLQASAVALAIKNLCDKLVPISSDDVVLLESQAGLSQHVGLPGSRRMQICELGQQRVESLSRRWLVATSPAQLQPRERDDKAREITKQLRSVLSADVIPHHPWIVLVLIEQTDKPESLAVSSGFIRAHVSSNPYHRAVRQ